ncbi:MAG: PilC/PilY family type IV pilus protein, partial [Gemmatimonadales bacterium]
AGAGSAASVLASSSTGEGAVYQSFFYPRDEDAAGNRVSWTGYTQVLFIDSFGNLREDSNGDGALVYSDDKIIETRYDPIAGEVVLDRFDDADGNGLADSTTPSQSNVPMKSAKSIWEAGDRLAATASCARNIETWVDLNNNGSVDAGEQIEFNATCTGAGHTNTSALLDPYLRPGAAPFTTGNIINFIRGDEITGLRGRQLDNGSGLRVWKLGDIVNARATVVGAPQQRFDILYGDSSYTGFFSKYRNRRQVAYLGANDGMLHAFNGGYFHRGDDTSTTTKTEHGYFTRNPTNNTSGKQLGDELFGFIPQELLPHLKWLTDPNYTHVYYVDLTPKITDARIFDPSDPDHPNGWGTILMGGFRLGGSCGACSSSNGAPPMTVNADFSSPADGDTVDPGDTRTFYSAYFVLDITNPEASDYPRLMWSFSSADLGLTTTVPSMLRVSPESNTITDNTNAKWHMIMGSGPTGYNGSVAQSGKVYTMDLKTGTVTTLSAETLNAFMGRPVTIDRDFDYRVEVAYMGSVIDDTAPPWRGKLYRLTMNTCPVAGCSPNAWGIDVGGVRTATEVLDTFGVGPLKLGPMAAAPAVAIDGGNKLWVFAGTGRYYDNVDRTSTDQQYFVGVKDSVMNDACTESTTTNCLPAVGLVDVSGAKVCVIGTGTCGSAGNEQVTGVTGATTFPSLIAKVGAKDGWYTTLALTGERALVRPLVLGGVVLFPTYVPAGDPCGSTGESHLYALYYLTGSAYSTPVIGKDTGAGGTEYVKRSTALGEGMASEVAVHVGHNSARGAAKAFVQKSTGEMTG